jgi:hypothetical protein
MINAQFIDELANKIADAMPQGVTDIQKDVEKNVRAVLQTAFTKFNLVTREEFEVQRRVLEQTRAKLGLLEEQIAELEKQVQQQ